MDATQIERQISLVDIRVVVVVVVVVVILVIFVVGRERTPTPPTVVVVVTHGRQHDVRILAVDGEAQRAPTPSRSHVSSCAPDRLVSDDTPVIDAQQPVGG